MGRYKLGDICEIVSGSTPKTGIAEYWDGDVKWITPAEINEDSYIVMDSARKITELAVNKTGLTPFPAGTVILSSRAPIGKVAIAGCEMYCNQGFKNLICSEKINNRYLYWFLKGNTDFLNSLGRGATFKEISKQIVANVELNVPEYEKQLIVVAHLEKVNEIIKLRKQKLAKLDKLIKSRFVELFGDTVLNPFGWEKDSLGSVCDVRDGTHDSPKYYETGYPLVTSKNVTGGKIDLTDCSLICEADFNKINERSKVDNGDIIMPMIGTVGKPVIVDIEPDFAIKNVALIKFKTDSRVLNIYIRALLQSDYFDDAVLSKVRGGTQKFISLGDIRKLDVLVPPIELQNQFAEFVIQVDKLKVEVQKSLDETQLLFDSLMQQYFG
ncbi:MAG: restriction endonuclease subunit S [Lachnospiraceae bacterium]|nr:restriction endonuclease subunit S [Lachnospiraceae bacterium]